MKNILVFVLIITSGLGFVNNVYPQVSGTLNTAFANGGELGDSLLIPPFRYSALALSPGNGFVLSNARGGSDTIQVVRYTSDGARDTTFGSDSAGYVKVVASGFSGVVTTSLVQTDQKILIAGQYTLTGKAFLLRLNANGTVDNTFGTNGWCFFNFFPHYGESIHQIALQTNGSIVALDVENYPGFTDTFMVARVKSNGTFDNTFATNGSYQVPFYNFLATSPSVFMLDANNNITCAAYSNYNAGDYFYLFRLTQNGVADATYGNGGSILIDSTNIINGGSELGLNFQSDGKLITVQTKQTGALLWAVCRYNADGSTDQSFGNNGLVSVQPNLFPVPYAVQNIASTATGQIITAGVATVAGANRLIVNSFNANGSVDASFGNNQGSELMNCFQLDDIVYNLLIQPNNDILINGLVNESDYQQFQVIELFGATGSTSIKEANNNACISIYPNPAGNEISIKLTKASSGTINVKNMVGNVILSQVVNNNDVLTLDIGKLARGPYVVTWMDGGLPVSELIIKQ